MSIDGRINRKAQSNSKNNRRSYQGLLPAILNMKKILITGFKPFLSNAVNPTEELVNSLIKEGYKGQVLKVSYKEADEFFLKIKPGEYDFILSFGLAANRTKVSLEKYAYNLKSTSLKDEDGYLPSLEDKVIDKTLPGFLSTNVDVEGLSDKLNKLGFQTYVSLDPGRYLCNYVYFKDLSKCLNQALFIHLPQLKGDVTSFKMLQLAKAVILYLLDSEK